MTGFLDMGKYAPFIWGAYGFALLTILAMIGASLLSARSHRRALERLELSRSKP